MAKYIFFVHGYASNSKDAWGNFPKLLQKQLGEEYTIDCIDYVSPSRIMFWKSAPNHLSIAESSLTQIKNKCDLPTDEIIFVAHSNGGIVVKKLLERIQLKNIKHNITKICFLDVPHTGSGFAYLGSAISPRNKHIKALKVNSDDLLEINDRWNLNGYDSELQICNFVAEVNDVVSRTSSTYRYNDSITIPSVSHSTIAKPTKSDDYVVLELEKFIKSHLKLDKYIIRASSTYKSWRKLDRHHHLEYVEDAKRKSALTALEQALNSETPLVRLTGLSGLGKSRLIVEYIEKFNIPEEKILIYDASVDPTDIKNTLLKACESEIDALFIIENCGVNLHNTIQRLIGSSSKLKIITVDFYHEKVQSSAHIKLERLGKEELESLVKQLLPKANKSYIDRIAKFVEGFPLLVDMLIQNLRESGELNTEFTESDLVEKLINGDKNLSSKHRELLQVMSLFDYFQCERGSNEVKNTDKLLINDIAASTDRDFDSVITHFNNKELINVTGRFARVTPKPLALNLASEWWRTSLFDRQNELISSLPDSLVESFGKQIVYLDSSINVQDFVKDFCATGRPFAQAEQLLSKAGSRLFRSLVEVNPNVTSELLYQVLNPLSGEEIKSMDSKVRRNLVWALEMLVYHPDCFENSAWCLFKLSQFESESYSNNATGQFSQLYRWQLSGTGANFSQRLHVLKKAFQLNSDEADTIIIKAIDEAFSTYGRTRTIGAEHQGTKDELKEWMPQTWDELFEYWQELLNILVSILERGRLTELVKESFGSSIRGLMDYKQYKRLDWFIKKVVELSGKYWPTATQSIRDTLHYDHDELDDKQTKYLKSWEKLLTPDIDNIEEKIKLIVLTPPREHIKGEDGHYKDLAAENAKQFATELKNTPLELLPYLELFFTFHEQRQSSVFSMTLVEESDDCEELINAALEYLRHHEYKYNQFFSGLLIGLFRKSPTDWNTKLELISTDHDLIKYYPDAIRTGLFTKSHLDKFLSLIAEGKLPSSSAHSLTYGSVTEHLNEKEIIQFCSSLGNIDSIGAWTALDNLNMYTYGRKDIKFGDFSPIIKKLVLSVSFEKKYKSNQMDSYHWLEFVKKLLKTENVEFAEKLCFHLVEQVSNYDISYSDLWDYIGIAFFNAFEIHGDSIWPKISYKFLDGEASNPYRLIDLLGSSKSFKRREKSVFDILEQKTIINWCQDEVALLIVARSTSLIVSKGTDSHVNPLLLELISTYGDNKYLLSEIQANFNSRSWTGSLVPYLEDDKALILPYTDSENTNIRSWAQALVDNIDEQIKYNETKDSEEKILWGN